MLTFYHITPALRDAANSLLATVDRGPMNFRRAAAPDTTDEPSIFWCVSRPGPEFVALEAAALAGDMGPEVQQITGAIERITEADLLDDEGNPRSFNRATFITACLDHLGVVMLDETVGQ